MADNKRLSLGGRVATPRLGGSPVPSLSLEAAIARSIGAKIRITVANSNPNNATAGSSGTSHSPLEMFIFAVHSASNLLALTPTFPSPPQPRLVFVPISSIQTFTVLSLGPSAPSGPSSSSSPSSPSSHSSSAATVGQPSGSGPNSKSSTGGATLPLPSPLPSAPLTPAAQLSRLREATARAIAKDARRGKGVTREAQSIFDAIDRTLSSSWDGENIIVLGEVLIAKPYRTEDCRIVSGEKPQMLQHVSKVLESVRRRLADNAGNSNNNNGNNNKDSRVATPTGQRKGG